MGLGFLKFIFGYFVQLAGNADEVDDGLGDEVRQFETEESEDSDGNCNDDDHDLGNDILLASVDIHDPILDKLNARHTLVLQHK